MPFAFRELDARLRELMVVEVHSATADGTLYHSKRFNPVGRTGWAGWLVAAAANHDEHWLAWQLEQSVAMREFETRSKPTGGYTTAHVPTTAAETLADGEFNRYYMCAVCRKAIADGKQVVTVYRAKHGATTRPESDALIGATYDPHLLVIELRANPAHELTKPNSGLSVHS
jgi:hypothetical protein